MTPFMLRVVDLLESDVLDVELPVPTTVPSHVEPVNVATDRQAALRGLAEQLVCEANAVLGDDGDQMSLTDEVTDGQLAFTVGYRGRSARIGTRFGQGQAQTWLVADGLTPDGSQELAGPEALPDLLVLLLAESDVPRHQAGHAW